MAGGNTRRSYPMSKVMGSKEGVVRSVPPWLIYCLGPAVVGFKMPLPRTAMLAASILRSSGFLSSAWFKLQGAQKRRSEALISSTPTNSPICSNSCCNAHKSHYGSGGHSELSERARVVLSSIQSARRVRYRTSASSSFPTSRSYSSAAGVAMNARWCRHAESVAWSRRSAPMTVTNRARPEKSRK
jgi:hypothetical protein